ncbi:leucine carboxyl methyltransferase [Poronia punctata]|nr:leucine carboxyl methyltransferase [Poronia punctata]
MEMDTSPPNVKPKRGPRVPRGAVRTTKERAQDELVMQTNSSSIVSKRSVERIYYPNEPHFFRYFVRKFMRRAPLINRGYHLRLHVIDLAVRRFLERPSDKTKVVVNLGCGSLAFRVPRSAFRVPRSPLVRHAVFSDREGGVPIPSDVLPWQCMARYPDACRRVKFVDIDFPDLMSKKRTIVLDTPELRSVFEPLDTAAGEHVLLDSELYCQIGCDLRNTVDLEKSLSIVLDGSDCIFMFVAEVSITYMETQGADGVIKWANSLGQAEFCLLEQILPDGPHHPFAKTMLSHFDKLKTPLKSVFEYADLEAQRRRFSRLGWSEIEADSLWQIWNDDKWISESDRRILDEIEPFDEWEEFALFSSHYCVVMARNVNGPTVQDQDRSTAAAVQAHPRVQDPHRLGFHAYSSTKGKRRFGAAMKLWDALGQDAVADTFGIGANNRPRSCDLYVTHPPLSKVTLPTLGPGNRVCHTVVDLGHSGSLLVGGRGSPTTALRDCWHFSTESNKWSPAEDLPVPLYRHATTRLGRSNMALLLGGKSDACNIFSGCLLYRPGSGWTKCLVSGTSYRPVFGATLVSFQDHHASSESANVQFAGILAGGLSADGTVSRHPFRWSLTIPEHGEPILALEPMPTSQVIDDLVCRFGAHCLPLRDTRFVILGGIKHDGLVPQADELLVIDVADTRVEVLTQTPLVKSDDLSHIPRPVLVGISASLINGSQLIVMGGGATCFSMGTTWNEGSYIIDLASVTGSLPSSKSLSSLHFERSVEIIDFPTTSNKTKENGAESSQATVTMIPRVRVESSKVFEEIVQAGKPVIIQGSHLGACIQKWTATYLNATVGPEKKVVVHEATTSAMDFNAKNFRYVTQDFSSFIAEAERGAKQYLRALSEEHPSDEPANLERDFPGLAGDFQLPPELAFVTEHLFSSVLRISGRVNMWLHYDVMANVYCQISGSKRLILFPPTDVSYLSIPPGSSSSSIDVFTSPLTSTHPHEATLNPGDILFLPPVWLHTATPLSDLGVAVNVFFRSLETGYSTGRDVYGNRDVAAYEKGRQDIARLLASLDKLPRGMREFYTRRLAAELAGNCPR